MGALDGRVAIVTGGASGIGARTVRLFVEQGARVMIGDMQEELGRTVADELRGSALFQRTEVSREDDLLALVASCTSQKKIDDAVANVTQAKDAQITALQKNLTTLQLERKQLGDQRLEAMGQAAVCNKTLEKVKDSIDDCTTKAAQCWQDREKLEAQNKNLTTKTAMLQDVVDVCNKYIKNLG